MEYAIIMAGGSGTRLWPLSRQKRPKQILPLTGDLSLYQLTVERLLPMFPPERILVVTCPEHAALLREQPPLLPAENFLVEPEGRGTAPAIGLAAARLHQRDPAAAMAVLTADHHIADQAAFRQALSAGLAVAAKGMLVTLGIRPRYAATGFGYVQQGESLGESCDLRVFRIARFVEKPDRETAETLVASGEYSWNSGIFVWKVRRILDEFRRQMPVLFAQLEELQESERLGRYDVELQRIWPAVARQSIDYGIMEGAADAAVIPVEIGWTDVGSWDAVRALLPADAQGNTLRCEHVAIDTAGTLVIGGKRLIAAVGLRDLVIVDTEDALLVCRSDSVQQVKEIVEALKKSGREEFL